MPTGPIELLIVRFPGNRFKGEIIPALRELVEAGTVRIADLVFVLKDADGIVTSVELADLGEEATSGLAGVVEAFDGLLSAEDIAELAETLEKDSSALLLLFENSWAARFVEAARNANGELVFNERIPRAVIEELVAGA
jgi:uncharacterized membrane protein